jgi:hypothetical protein
MMKVTELISEVEQNVVTTEQSIKVSKVPLIDESNFNNIVHTNKVYQAKLKNGGMGACDKQTFNEFIDTDMENIKHLNWNQIPIAHKYKYMCSYIHNDTLITELEKNNLLSIVSVHNTNITGLIKYSKKLGTISKFNYALLLN